METIFRSQILSFEKLQQARGHFIVIAPILNIMEAKGNDRVSSNISDTQLHHQNVWLQGYWSQILVTSNETDGAF